MKTLLIFVVPLVRVIATLSLLATIAASTSQAQVSFLQPLTFPAGGPTVYADFNRDGNLDIATPGTLLLGNGDGTFKAPINLSVSGILVATADFNSDGNPDLVVASSQSTLLNILLGNGDGTFQAAKSLNVGTSFQEIAVADVNGDGKPDVLGLVGLQVFVFLGNGDGTLKPGVPYSAGPNPDHMLIGDFNGDGKLDIATACATTGGLSSGTIAFMQGNGDGTFLSPVTSTGVDISQGFAASDVNGDGKLDLIISDSTTNQTYTFSGNGDGTFQPGIMSAPFVGSLGVADLNGDGKVDLIVGQPNLIEGFATILLGNGDGTFTYSRAYAVPGGGSILIADFNNDGSLDLAVGGTMLLGNGNGTFKGQPVSPLSPGSHAAVGDFNGDGIPDLAVTSENNFSYVYILLGDGVGFLNMKHTYTLPVPGYSIAAGDLNDDGKLDLAIFAVDSISQDWSLDVMLGNGDGTFGSPTVYPQGQNVNYPSGPGPVVVADLRADHRPYVLVPQGNSLVVFPNNGNGTLGTPVTYFAGSQANGLVVADFNNDGKLDAAVSSSAGIGILLGNGDGTFQGAAFTSAVGTGLGMFAGDFNNDGKSDLIVDSEVFLGNGDGTFTALTPGFAAYVVGIADFNGDGNLDLVADNCPGSTSQFHIECISLGNGDGTFGSPVTVATDLSTFTAVADFNLDQKPDIANGTDAGGLFMFLNTTAPAPGSNLTPSAVNFGSQASGTVSNPVPVTLTNTGTAGLTVTSVAITGANATEFGQTNNCTMMVQPSGTCTINVTFAPTATGLASATLMVTDNTVSGAQTAALSGVVATPAPDFSIGPTSGAPTSASVSAGQSATFNLAVTPLGSFTGTVILSCSISPTVSQAPSCSLPSSVNVTAGTAVPVTVTVATVLVSAGTVFRVASPPATIYWASTVALFVLGFLSMHGRRRRVWAAAVVMSAFVTLPGCGGSSSSAPINPGTPSDTYVVSVSAKSGSLSHNTTLTVVVQ